MGGTSNASEMWRMLASGLLGAFLTYLLMYLTAIRNIPNREEAQKMIDTALSKTLGEQRVKEIVEAEIIGRTVTEDEVKALIKEFGPYVQDKRVIEKTLGDLNETLKTVGENQEALHQQVYALTMEQNRITDALDRVVKDLLKIENRCTPCVQAIRDFIGRMEGAPQRKP